MRVVHVAPSYCRQDGGPSEALRGMLPALERRGVDVALVTTDKGLTEAERADPPVAATTTAHHRGPYSLSYAQGFAPAVREAIHGADVVHVHAVDNLASLVGMREAARAGVPFVLQPHGAWNGTHRRRNAMRKRVWEALLENRWARHAARVIVSSSREADEAGARHGSPPRVVVPFGVDESLFDIDRAWEDREGAVWIGRLTGVKRFDLVLAAIAADADGPALTVAGVPAKDLGFELRSRIAELKLGDRVTFVGQVDATARRALLAGARAFILPSDDESFGIAAAEAAAAGVAVVASPAVGAIADAAAAGVGDVTPPEPAALAAALARATADEQPPSVAALRTHAREYWTWESAGDALAAAYEDVVR